MSTYPTVTSLKRGQFGILFGQSLTPIGDSLIKYEKAGDKQVKMTIEVIFKTDIENWDEESKIIPEKLGSVAIGSTIEPDNQTKKNFNAQFLVDPEDIILQINAAPPPPGKGVHSS